MQLLTRSILNFLFLFSSLLGKEREVIAPEIFSGALDFFGWPNSRFDPLSVRERDVIYVVSNFPYFLSTHHPKISTPYILISNRTIRSVSEEWLHYLDDPKILLWFAQNPGIFHPKLIPIPLGVDSRKVAILEEYRIKSFEKKHLLYLNFSLKTNFPVRSRSYELFKDQTYCYVQSNRDYEDYLEDLSCSYFVLSPQGLGLDCYRTWEALYMGSIPIVESSTLDPLFEDLPVLIVERFEQISEDFLKEKYNEMCHKTYKMEKLTPQYWVEKVKSAKFNQSIDAH